MWLLSIFLTHTYFNQKFGVEQFTPEDKHNDIVWHELDLNRDPCLTFDNDYFSTVTMLAVAEHLNPTCLVDLYVETFRILIPGGRLIITTPAAWTNQLLNIMAKMKLVSEEEIKEHVYLYTLPLLGWYFGRAGFDMNKVRFGYFEFFLNMWAYAEK